MEGPKKYDSTVSFQGKKLAQIRFVSETIFQDSLLWIEVDHHNQDFIVFIDNKALPAKAEKFEKDYKMCKLRIFQEISMEDLRNPSRAQGSK